jgi:hypothetical protein
MMCISAAGPGISKRESAVLSSQGGRRAVLKCPQWVKSKAVVGVQGAKPPETDEFLQVKGGFFFNLNLR